MARLWWMPAFLQVTGREPVEYKTKGAALEELRAQVALALERGWRKAFGSVAADGGCVLEKDGERRALVVSLVDKEGYELKGRERTGRRSKLATGDLCVTDGPDVDSLCAVEPEPVTDNAGYHGFEA